MAFKSLGGAVGYLALTANTPARITANQTEPAKKYSAHTLFIQQHEDNTEVVYLLDRATGASIATGVGVLAAIPAPTLASGVGTLIPWLAVTIPYAPGGLNAADYYLMTTASSQKVIVSAVVA